MGKWLLVLFTVVPLVEFYLLMYVGSLIGFWPTVGIVLVTGLIGASLAKMEGARVMLEWQRELGQGRMPEEGVMGGLMVLIGGVLLVTPGVLTDLFGLSLLLPMTRRFYVRVARKRLEKSMAAGRVQVFRSAQAGGQRVDWFGGFGGFDGAGGHGGFGDMPQVIDVDGEEVEAPNDKLLH